VTHDADSSAAGVPEPPDGPQAARTSDADAPDDVAPVAGFDDLAPSARALPTAARLRLGIGAAVVLVLAALAVAVAVAVFGPHGDESAVPAVSARTRAGSGGQAATTAPSAQAVYVHVLGAVAHPGLYVLPSGCRVVDAVAAAGGFAKNADHGGVNLAQVISDGEQLVVPVVGQAPAAAPKDAPAAAGASTVAGAKVNLNTASETELETLPRIGPSLAQRIIDWRTKNGRFASVDDLTNVTGIGEKTFDGLKDRVTV